MANSGKKDEKITIKDAAGGKRELDLSAFAEKLAPMIKDPADEFVSTDPSRPPAAPQTPGPHRYTISVPSNDNTTLNLGAPMGIFNAGIGGVTDTSVYFAARTGKVTALHLGAPVPSGPTAVATAEGFAVDTAGQSYVVSKEHGMYWSLDGDVRVAAGRDIFMYAEGTLAGQYEKGINLATKGNFSLTVGETPEVKVTLGSVFGGVVALAADFVDPVGPAVGGVAQPTADAMNFISAAVGEIDGATQIRDFVIAKAGSISDKILVHVGTVAALVTTIRKLRKKGKEGEAGLASTDGASAVVGVLAEGLKFYQDFIKKPEDPNLSLKAVGTVEVASDKSCAISAPNGVGISGLKSVDVSSLAVGIKGHKDASVFGGITASLKALAKDVSVSSDHGGVTVTGKGPVTITSEEQDVRATAKMEAQLNGRMAFLHGESRAFVGSGAATGFGMIATPDELKVGRLENAKDFKCAKASGAVMTVNADGIKMIASSTSATASTRATFEIKPGELLGEFSTLDLSTTGNATFGAKGKILLG